MQAMTGVDQIAADRDTHVTSGRLGIEGRVGSMKLGLRGRYLQMEPGAAVHEPGAVLASGATSTLSLEMATADDGTRVELTSLSKRMVGGAGEDTATPVDFEHYGVQVSKVLGDGQSDFTAQYTSQSNFHRHGVSDPAQIPEASSTWRLEGTYTLPLSDRSTLQTGIRYRALEPQSLAGLDRDGDHYQTQEQVDLFGRGGIRVLPAVVMEYGLYTTLRDGTVSMMPRGGVVLQLSPTWQASTLASHKVEQGNGAELLNDFVPAFFGDAGTCEQNEEYCYHLLLTHRSNDTDSLSFGATQREFSDTRRLYFSDELFDRMESIYLVPGDQVPELQFAVSRQLTPTIVTRLESSVGSGGGGTFYTTDQVPFTNHVDYLVTSLDTQFQSTATGLFLAFHRLSQQLDSPATDAFADPRSYEAERLQLVVTQNLNILLDLAADWALQLNMEVSRSHDPGSLDPRNDELRKRLLGGIAIRF
jgi:hypothetical protein